MNKTVIFKYVISVFEKDKHYQFNRFHYDANHLLEIFDVYDMDLEVYCERMILSGHFIITPIKETTLTISSS